MSDHVQEYESCTVCGEQPYEVPHTLGDDVLIIRCDCGSITHSFALMDDAWVEYDGEHLPAKVARALLTARGYDPDAMVAKVRERIERALDKREDASE